MVACEIHPARRWLRDRCELDAAQQAIGRALDIYDAFPPVGRIGYAEALGARSHLRQQLHDERVPRSTFAHPSSILSKHQYEARPALLGAYAEPLRSTSEAAASRMRKRSRRLQHRPRAARHARSGARRHRLRRRLRRRRRARRSVRARRRRCERRGVGREAQRQPLVGRRPAGYHDEQY